MKEIMKNKKGFTLVELLAVIVVLAIIILIAMPSVMSAMEKARKNALKTEASEVIKIAQTAYTSLIMDNTIVSGKHCFSVRFLADKHYMEKSYDDNYHGSVLVDVAGDNVTYKVWLSNGAYTLTGVDGDKVSAATPVASNTKVSDLCGGGAGIELHKVDGDA